VSQDDEDRKYEPTPKRKEQFRKEGKFARARDAGAVAALVAGLGVAMGMRDAGVEAVRALFAATLGDPGALSRGEVAGTTRALWGAFFVLVVPLCVATTLATAVAGFAQAGVAPNTEVVGFKLERLDPLPRLKQLFSLKHGGFEVVLAIAKVVVVGGVAYSVTHEELPTLLGLWAHDVAGGSSVVAGVIGRILLETVGAAFVVCAADYAYNRWTLSQEMKMTLKELKEEMRQEDGDPKLKARMRAKARALAKKRMMMDVKTASVVIANPTHVSVALRYRSADPAPIVVAKGHDDIALSIRAKARQHGIPIVENRPLARTLDAEVALGHPVQVEHFAAVAKVLAFVHRLKQRRTGARAPV
jgi:flagellar biosynthetic protein FlhB